MHRGLRTIPLKTKQKNDYFTDEILLLACTFLCYHLCSHCQDHILPPVIDLGWRLSTFECHRAKTLAELRAHRFIQSAFGASIRIGHVVASPLNMLKMSEDKTGNNKNK